MVLILTTRVGRVVALNVLAVTEVSVSTRSVELLGPHLPVSGDSRVLIVCVGA